MKKIKYFAIILSLICFGFLCEGVDSITNISLQRIKNSWASVQNGDEIVIDDDEGAFYGVFKIQCELAKDQYYGHLKVKIYAQKKASGVWDETWRLIKTVTVPSKPTDTSAWTVTTYWNSREAYSSSLDTGDTAWGASDANGYEGDLKLKIKVVEE
jgi:hypothetical protein